MSGDEAMLAGRGHVISHYNKILVVMLRSQFASGICKVGIMWPFFPGNI